MTDLVYAGIGSRETPKQILDIMHHVASYLCAENWTLRSGGANGADSAFEAGVDHIMSRGDLRTSQEPSKHIYLPWKGHNHSLSDLHPDRLPFSNQEMNLAAQFHPAWHKCSASAKILHARNVRILLGHEMVDGPVVKPVKFIVCWTPNGAVTGGTGQALRMAEGMDIPVINFGSAKNPEQLQNLINAIDTLQGGFKHPIASSS